MDVQNQTTGSVFFNNSDEVAPIAEENSNIETGLLSHAASSHLAGRVQILTRKEACEIVYAVNENEVRILQFFRVIGLTCLIAGVILAAMQKYECGAPFGLCFFCGLWYLQSYGKLNHMVAKCLEDSAAGRPIRPYDYKIPLETVQPDMA
ncbi:MAG: hypothetical protein HY860_04755 [Chlamydiales bacterium]|nr:hypothetical protein [Chlamydiales bacterium]